MAIPQYTTEELIANIKRRCAVPTSQLTYSPEDFTLLANDELQGQVVPLLMATREEYFVDFVDIAVQGNEIDIPNNTVGEKLRSVCFVQQSSPLWLINIPRIDLDVVAGVGFANYATLAGFYIQGNKLILYPSQSVPQNTIIRLYYYKRTLVLAAPSTFGQIRTINTMTNTITLSFLPNDWATDTQLNAVASTSPFNATNELMTVVSVSSPSVILDSVDGLSVGDYVSEYGFSAIPQVPIEAHAYLAQRTSTLALNGLGAVDQAARSQTVANGLEKAMLVMVSQRVDGSVKKIVNPNGGLRMTGGLWRRGLGRF